MDKIVQFESGERVHLCVDGLVEGISGWFPATIKGRSDEVSAEPSLQKYCVKLDSPIESMGQKYQCLRAPLRALLPAKYIYSSK